LTQLWLNGALLPAAEARIDPADRGFMLGDGIFETIRAEGGAPAHVARHLARLRDGAAVLRIVVSYSDVVLTAALLAVAAGASCALRLTLTRGAMPRGVLPLGSAMPTVLITSAPLPPALPPARVIVARSTRRNEHSPLSRIKSLNYGDSILARQEADAAGADDALLLNTRGNLAEATAASVFLLVDGVLATPRICDGALPGITRARLLESGHGVERQLTMSDVQRADMGFLATALGVRRIAAIDGRILDSAQYPIPSRDAGSDEAILRACR
jgi:branched-chain amino acid aminotransferase